MQKNWLKHNLKNPSILTAAIQFVIYRMAQKSKLQFFPSLHQILKQLCEIYVKFINRPIWYRYEQEFGASFYGSPYKTVMCSYVYNNQKCI